MHTTDKKLKLKSRRQNGLMQSLDFSIAFLLMLVMVLVFAVYIFTELGSSERKIRGFRQERQSIMLLDGLLKRKASGAMGLALFDASKRRVKENRLNERIENENSWKDYKLSGLKAECEGTMVVYVPEIKGEECRVLSRLAYVKGKKCLLKARFCD